MPISQQIPNRVKALALAIALAAPAEGIRQFAYRDPVGILTICYGHTGADVLANSWKSLAECKGLLSEDMLKAIDTVERCAPGLPVVILAAFADAVFNVGQIIACDKMRSTAARLLAARKYTEACNELPKWDKARIAGVLVSLPGLTTRRAKEKELCLQFSASKSSLSQFSPRWWPEQLVAGPRQHGARTQTLRSFALITQPNARRAPIAPFAITRNLPTGSWRPLTHISPASHRLTAS